jgi:hypothetical protein
MATKTGRCPSCNKENIELENFCQNCGMSLNIPFQNPQNQQMQPVYFQPNQQMQPAPLGYAGQNQSGYYPSQLSTVSILQLIFGILEIIVSLIWAVYVFIIGIATFGIGLLLFFIPLIFFVVGLCSIISGVKGINKQASYGFSLFVAISQICLLLMCDVVSFIGGLIGLIFLMNDEVRGYFK